jgi:F0F1-type ATP synthase membrane subunit b/b'
MAVLVFLVQGKRFAGPPIGDEIKKRQAVIAEQENALAAAGDN